jgi:hypothetical protein
VDPGLGSPSFGGGVETAFQTSGAPDLDENLVLLALTGRLPGQVLIVNVNS